MIRRLSGHAARLAGDRRGATIIEFAIVAPVMLVLIFGLIDLGHSVYVKAQLEGSMQQAGRNSTLERNARSEAAVNAFVETRMRDVAGDPTFTPDRKTYKSFNDVGKPENYTDTKPANGKYDTGECFEDVNGNKKWDSDLGRTGQGGANDVVLYSMKMKYKRVFPIAMIIGQSPYSEITASTVMRNQPYDDQVIPAVVKCS